MKQEWIDNLRKQADGYAHKAPEGLLDDIKKEMSRRGLDVPGSAQESPAPLLHTSQQAGGKRLTITWGRRIAAVAAAVAAIFLVVNYWNSSDSVNQSTAGRIAQAIQEHRQKTSGEKLYADNNMQGGANSDGNSSIATHIYNVISAIGDNVYSAINNDIPQLVADLLPSEESNSTTKGNENESAETADKNSSAQKSNSGSNTPAHRPSTWYSSGAGQLVADNNVRTHNGFDISAGYTGMGSTSEASGFTGLQALNTGNTMVANNLDLEREAVADMTTDAHHNMPVKFGVNVRYRASKRWSIQTGVNYSYLSSDITKSNNIEEYNYKQKLHYVSVPLTASYSIWQNKNVNVYVSGGGEAAKLVSGKAKGVHSTYSEGSETPMSNSVSEHRLQYSVNGAVGVEYKAGNRLSIYAEPGVTHYFNNHSGVVNIYKDKPTQFSINVGLRLNINK